jgi:two-component system chemotaxis response regulator CheY
MAIEFHALEKTQFRATPGGACCCVDGSASRLPVAERRMAVDLAMPILVVDDYNTMIRIIRNLLKQIGFSDIDDAADGTVALSKMRGKRYGLVISDWNMEPMTGYELLKEIRQDPGIGKTPFIMVTAESKTDNVIAAKKAGVSNYIVKPFNAQTLHSKIEAVFGDCDSGLTAPRNDTSRRPKTKPGGAAAAGL